LTGLAKLRQIDPEERAAMKPYAWNCLACEATNAAELDACARCACPASATSARVKDARDAYRLRSGLPAVQAADPLALIGGLPLLPIAAVVLLLAGGLSLIVSDNGGTTAFGCLMLALSALCISSWRPARPGA
jgi:hypothetical protein